jgi:hypothetical protein
VNKNLPSQKEIIYQVIAYLQSLDGVTKKELIFDCIFEGAMLDPAIIEDPVKLGIMVNRFDWAILRLRDIGALSFNEEHQIVITEAGLTMTKEDCDAMPSLYKLSRERIRREQIRKNGGRELTLDDLLAYCNDEDN